MSQNEARNEKLHRSFELIEDEFIVEAAPYNAKPMTSLINKRINRLVLLAACICVIVGISIAPFSYLLNKTNVPISNIPYSATQIGDFWGVYDSYNGATNAYVEVFVPNEKYLNIASIPSEEYLTIYEIRQPKKAINEKEFDDFISYIFPKLCAEMNIEMPEYKTIKSKKAKDLFATSDSLEDLFFSQTSQSNQFRLYHLRDSDFVIEIDQRKTDTEIIRDIEPVKEKLFYIFGVEFSNIKIIREYDEYTTAAVRDIFVYFYNSDDHPLNDLSDRPITDYIELHFDNMVNYMGDYVSEDILSDPSIAYEQFRSDPDSRYTPIKKLKMISLEEAEELLCKGYVFGGHSCSLCMAEQTPVDFEGYDYVGFEYVRGGGSTIEVIPFYTFYKYISDAPNGNKTYANTYVPAIKVSGYEEYFESQAKYHKQSTGTEYVEVE